MTKISENKKSLIYTFGNIIPYAIVPLIWMGVGLGFENYSGLSPSIAKAIVVTTAKDILSAIAFLFIVIIKKQFKDTLRLLKTKAGMYAIVAGIFGGPIGYTLYNSAFFYSGASYSHIFTSLEPIILVLSGVFLFKRKYNYKMWLGVFITTISIVSLVFGSAFDSKDSWRVIVGAILGIFGAASWALETMLFDKAYNLIENKDKSLNNKLLTIKMVFAMIFGFAFMMPVFSKMATGNAAFDYESFGSIFTDTNYFLRFMFAGLLIIVGRYMYFYAIEKQGGTIVAIVYNLTIILTPIFMLLWFAFTDDWLTWDGLNKTTGEWIAIGVTTPFILIGISLVTLNKPIINRNN